MPDFTIHDLEKIVASRVSAGARASYTKSLLEKGPRHIAKKMGEEAVEIVISATAGERAETIREAADVLYHLLVLLKSMDISLADVEAELQRRTAQSGLEEKAGRKD